MDARQGSRGTPTPSPPRTRSWILAAVAAGTIVCAGCAPGPAAPVTRRIMINDELDTGACERDCSVTVFLGSQTRSFNFLPEISGLTNGATVTIGPPSGRGAITFSEDGSLGTGNLTGNVAVFRVRWSNDNRPKVLLSDVVVTQDAGFFITPATVSDSLTDTVTSMPAHLNAPVYLVQDHEHPTRYDLSVDGLPAASDPRVTVSLDRPGQIVVREAAAGFLPPEASGAWNRFDSDAAHPARVVPVPAGADRLLFTVTLPSGAGSGIARFVVSGEPDPLGFIR
jgi:hypothetical protein